MSKSHKTVKNPLSDGYDMEALVKAYPDLSGFIVRTKNKRSSINFADPEAVIALNSALLKHHFDISHWSIPEGYLCPAIPGRLEYLLQVKSLLTKNKDVRLLDIGCGANGIYSLLAHKGLGWTCVGVDVDTIALDNFNTIIRENKLSAFISTRRQHRADQILKTVLRKNEHFDLLVCNPPFHASLKDAKKANTRKRRGLNLDTDKKLNFGGIQSEMVYPGGETAFIQQMIKESFYFKEQIDWFSSLVSNEDNLGPLIRDLKNFKDLNYRILPFALGNKKTRILAWTFVDNKPQTTKTITP